MSNDDPRIGSRNIGGPLSAKDIRMFFHVEELELLLMCARASNVNKVELNMVGIRGSIHRSKGTGMTYEVWKFVSGPPKPANSEMMKSLTGKTTTFNHG
jgi:hypothetical protein